MHQQSVPAQGGILAKAALIFVKNRGRHVTRESLRKWRIVVPGVLLYLALSPLIRGDMSVASLLSIDLKSLINLGAVFVLGALYRTLGFRDVLFSGAIYEIRANLRDGLVQPFDAEPFAPVVRQMDPKRIMSTFYFFVDNDASLKTKTSEVYENGLMLSSFADAFVVGVVGLVCYGVAYLRFRNSTQFFFTAAFLLLTLISYFLARLSLERHKKLGNEQVEVITTHYRAQLQHKLEAVAADADHG
jgi:hypothetical protein